MKITRYVYNLPILVKGITIILLILLQAEIQYIFLLLPQNKTTDQAENEFVKLARRSESVKSAIIEHRKELAVVQNLRNKIMLAQHADRGFSLLMAELSKLPLSISRMNFEKPTGKNLDLLATGKFDAIFKLINLCCDRTSLLVDKFAIKKVGTDSQLVIHLLLTSL